MSKTFTMYAVPFVSQDMHGTLDVAEAGAMALFSSQSLADDFLGDSTWPREPVKVRVTIEKSGSHRKGAPAASRRPRARR